MAESEAPLLELEIWGSGQFNLGPVGEKILLAIRTKPESAEELASEIGAHVGEIEAKLDEMSRQDLVMTAHEEGRWLAKIPIFSRSETIVTFQIAQRYAETEKGILSRELPRIEETYKRCMVSKRHPWTEMSLIVTGALIADILAIDRIPFLPKHFKQDFLPPLHPDGTRWALTGYEKGAREFPKEVGFLPKRLQRQWWQTVSLRVPR